MVCKIKLREFESHHYLWFEALAEKGSKPNQPMLESRTSNGTEKFDSQPIFENMVILCVSSVREHTDGGLKRHYPWSKGQNLARCTKYIKCNEIYKPRWAKKMKKPKGGFSFRVAMIVGAWH